MIKADLYNQKGEKKGSVELKARIFGVKPNADLLKQAYVTQLANARTNIAHTKTRAEVRGGGIKPWRQKGTGRARHGSIRSPLWIGGGVTFGPRNERNFSKSINQKQKQKAIFMALSSKVSDKEIAFVDALDMEGKTKDAVEFLNNMAKKVFKKEGKFSVLVVLPNKDDKIKLAVRNVPNAKVTYANSVNVADILNHRYAVVLEGALEVLDKTFTKLNK